VSYTSNSLGNVAATFGKINDVIQHPGWFIALGVAFIIGGILAIYMPTFASIAVALTVGWVFIFVGVAGLVQAWQVWSWSGAIWTAITGLITLAGGIALLLYPDVGALSLTLLLGAVFVAKGISQIIFGFNYRPFDGWGWVVAAGVLSVVVGGLILFSWPSSADWALGTLAGVSLIFSGWSYIAMGTAARRVASA
jgi:uncharacterized membrane protein HdeD (DUF308 family)